MYFTQVLAFFFELTFEPKGPDYLAVAFYHKGIIQNVIFTPSKNLDASKNFKWKEPNLSISWCSSYSTSSGEDVGDIIKTQLLLATFAQVSCWYEQYVNNHGDTSACCFDMLLQDVHLELLETYRFLAASSSCLQLQKLGSSCHSLLAAACPHCI